MNEPDIYAGPAVLTVVVGMIMLALAAALVLHVGFSVNLDTDVALPGLLIGIGTVLVVSAGIGLLRGRANRTAHQQDV
ncbi:MAG: hypothetical protein CSA58_09215 [Micrococcales bacterium]|nr:MAG: hypothetical protein CSA58_09215 [Micrococcales bacterium]